MSDTPSAIERDAAIQRFEYSVELSWKLAREYLLANEGLDIASPKAVIRALREGSIIEMEESINALKMIDDRNLTSHTYNEALADQIYQRLEEHYRIMSTILYNIQVQINKK